MVESRRAVTEGPLEGHRKSMAPPTLPQIAKACIATASASKKSVAMEIVGIWCSRVGAIVVLSRLFFVFILELLEDFPYCLVLGQRLRLGVGELKNAAIELSVVHIEEGVLSVLHKFELNKSETAVLVGRIVHRHNDLCNLTKRNERLVDDLFRDSIIDASCERNQRVRNEVRSTGPSRSKRGKKSIPT